MTEQRSRQLTLERKLSKGNTFPATLTTEAPVLRYIDGREVYEVLDMSRLDLSRAPLPLIESHDQTRLNIGIVEDVHVEGRRLRGTIRLGTSARAQEVAEDIRAGIVRSVSVGYRVSDPVDDGERDGRPVYRFAAEIFELSLVAAPADKDAGIYRSQERTMSNETQTPERTEEQLRVQSIRQAGERFGQNDLATRAIDQGWSVDDFNEECLRRSTNAEPRRETYSENWAAGMPADTSEYGRIRDQYSVVKAIRALTDPKAMKAAGLEIEISEYMQRNSGKETSGIIVPLDMLATRATTYSGTSAATVATTHLAGSFIDVLRNRSVIMGLNPTILTGLVGNVAIPRKTAGASASWIAGDDGDSISATDATYDQVTMSPKVIGGATTFSHRMMVQSSPGIEDLVRRDLADLIAVEIDAAAINGSGSSNEPTGIIGQAGVSSDTYANGGTPDWADVIALETALADANADRGALHYLTTPTLAAALKQVDQGTDTGQWVWTGSNSDGRMNGYPARATKNVPAGYILFGNFADLIIGMWSGVELDVDRGGSNFLKGSATVRAMMDLDIEVRHGESFAEIHEAAP